MTTTEIVILAQGERRLGCHGPVQLQPLPACGGVPVLCRTVRQVSLLQAESSDGMWWPTIVAWEAVCGLVSWPEPSTPAMPSRSVTPAYYRLADPGNSALRGVARYLELRHQENRRYDHTIILLGDVVYSWACLRALWDMAKTGGFVGTSDLSLDKGELWGAAWSRRHEDRMVSELRDALLRHPPLDDEYQHGQFRRWVSGFRRGDLADHADNLRRSGIYVDIDDYTHDIDHARDLVLLPLLSFAADADDRSNGITWEGVSWQT